MLSIEGMSQCIAANIGSILKLDKETEEVLAYGAFSIIQTIWSIALISFFGFIFDVFIYALIISFSAAVLRKYSGGAHASSPGRCAAISVFLFVGFAITVKHFTYTHNIITILLCIIGFSYAYYVINKYSPIDSPSKPIKKEETKRRLHKGSVRVMWVYAVVVIGLLVLDISMDNTMFAKLAVGITIGFSWQALTLISPGHNITLALDDLMRHITNYRGGEII